MEYQAITGAITAIIVEIGKRVTGNTELTPKTAKIVKAVAAILSLLGVVLGHYATEGELDIASFQTLVGTLVAYGFSYVTYKGIIKGKEDSADVDPYV